MSRYLCSLLALLLGATLALDPALALRVIWRAVRSALLIQPAMR